MNHLCSVFLGIALFRYAAAADVVQQCAGEECESTDELFLLQKTDMELKPTSRSATTCDPCEVRIQYKYKELQMDIYVPSETTSPTPVVLVWHGQGGDVKTMKPHCKKHFVAAGYVCVSIDPLNPDNNPGYYTEEAIKYLIDHAKTYAADVDNIFLYGYSKGGHSQLNFMMFSTDPTRERVKGFISDASAPGDKKYDWKAKDDQGNYILYPPYFMMHCTEDPTMKPKWSVSKSVKNINKANKKRGTDEQIIYHYMKFKGATGCGHSSLLLNSEDGSQAATDFISNIMNGDDPFEGIPAQIEEANSVR